MVKLYDSGAYLIHGQTIIPETEAAKAEALTGKKIDKQRQERVQSHMESWKHTILPEIWRT